MRKTHIENPMETTTMKPKKTLKHKALTPKLKHPKGRSLVGGLAPEECQHHEIPASSTKTPGTPRGFGASGRRGSGFVGPWVLGFRFLRSLPQRIRGGGGDLTHTALGSIRGRWIWGLHRWGLELMVKGFRDIPYIYIFIYISI